MQILLYITIIILFLLVALIIMPLRVRIVYCRQGADDKITLEMSLWKLPKYKRHTNLVDFQWSVDHSGIKFKSKNKKSGYITRKLVTLLASFPKKEDDIKDGDFTLRIPHKIGELKQILSKINYQYQRYWPFFKYLFCHTHCRRLYWRTQIGFADAAMTGWVTGLLWTLKPIIVGKLFSIVLPAQRPVIMVQPDFNQAQFAIDFDCIFEVRLGHIMVTGIKLAFRK